jgi:hypothetical protein
MITKEDLKFVPNISPSEKDFRQKIGVDDWEKLKSKTFRDDNHKCITCSFEPFDVDPNEILNIHLEEENPENLIDSKIRTICVFCHMIEHADVAISKGYVELVNSHYTQGEIVNICRNGFLSNHIQDGSIRILKKDLQEYLEELKSGRSKEGKIKLIFTKKFFKEMNIG